MVQSTSRWPLCSFITPSGMSRPIPSNGSDPSDRWPGPISELTSAEMPVFGDPPRRRRSRLLANLIVRRTWPGSWVLSTSQSAKIG